MKNISDVLKQLKKVCCENFISIEKGLFRDEYKCNYIKLPFSCHLKGDTTFIIKKLNNGNFVISQLPFIGWETRDVTEQFNKDCKGTYLTLIGAVIVLDNFVKWLVRTHKYNSLEPIEKFKETMPKNTQIEMFKNNKRLRGTIAFVSNKNLTERMRMILDEYNYANDEDLTMNDVTFKFRLHT